MKLHGVLLNGMGKRDWAAAAEIIGVTPVMFDKPQCRPPVELTRTLGASCGDQTDRPGDDTEALDRSAGDRSAGSCQARGLQVLGIRRC